MSGEEEGGTRLMLKGEEEDGEGQVRREGKGRNKKTERKSGIDLRKQMPNI